MHGPRIRLHTVTDLLDGPGRQCCLLRDHKPVPPGEGRCMVPPIRLHAVTDLPLAPERCWQAVQPWGRRPLWGGLSQCLTLRWQFWWLHRLPGGQASG